MGNVGNHVRMVLGLCLWLVMAECGCAASLQVKALSDLQDPAEDTAEKLRPFQRKLLMEEDQQLNLIVNGSNPKMTDGISWSPWPVLVGLVLSVLSVGFVIMMVVKFRIVQRFFGGYSEALLPEEDTSSQFSHIGTITANYPAHGLRERNTHTGGEEEDDDGFIEDNYITASDKERVERDQAQEEVYEESDDDLDIHFSID